MYLKERIRKVLSVRQAKNLGIYFAASIIGSGLYLVINPFLARNLTHEDYAIIGYFGSFNLLFTPLINFYFTTYYTKKYFELDENSRTRLRETLTLSLIVFSLFIGLTLLGLLRLYFFLAHISFPFLPYALLTISSILFTNLYSLRLADLRMKRDSAKFFWLSIANSVIGIVLAFFLVVVIKKGAAGRLYATFITSFILFAYILYKSNISWRIDWKYFREAIVFCWPLTVAAMLNYFFNGYDRLILEKLNDTYTFGLYAVATQISGYLVIFSNSIKQTFQPDVYEQISLRNTKKLIFFVLIMVLVNSLVVGVFILFAPIIIDILTSGHYVESTKFARILALSNISSMIYFSISSIIIGYGLTRITLLSKVISGILAIVLYQYLVNNWGFYGVAWGRFLSFIVMIIVTVVLFQGLKNRPDSRK